MNYFSKQKRHHFNRTTESKAIGCADVPTKSLFAAFEVAGELLYPPILKSWEAEVLLRKDTTGITLKNPKSDILGGINVNLT